MKKTERRLLLMVPSRLSFCLFYNGEYYKAIVCLCQYAQLVPEDVTVKDIIVKWLTYLGENELAEAKIKEFKMETVSPCLTEIVQHFLVYMKSKDRRAEKLEKIKACHEKIKENGITKKSFASYDLFSFSSWMMSLLSNVPLSTALENAEFPDRGAYLVEASSKADSLVRNRLAGLAPYSFENTAAANVLEYLERGNTPVSPTEYMSCASSLAWMFELRRELAMFNTSIAQAREAMSAFVLNWRVALRSGSLLRILQAINGAFYYYKVIDEPESKSYLNAIVTSCVNLLSPEAVVIRCSTPIRKEENNRLAVRTPVFSKKENIRKLAVDDENTLLLEITDNMNDLRIEEGNTLHQVSKTCICSTCEHYYNISSMSIEYQFSKALYSDFSQESIVELDKEYVEIRHEIMKVQRILFKEDVKPRPSIFLNEIFAICAIRWISNKIQSEERADETSVQILKNALKATKYVPIRTLEHSLILNQYCRKYRRSFHCRLSWMQPIESKPFVRMGIECALDIIRAVSPFGRKSKTTPTTLSEEEKQKEIEATAKMYQEVRIDNAYHVHLLYREWRANAFPYAARISQEPWESAYAWAEATAIGSRSALQSKIGTCKRDGVTISSGSKLKTCIRAMPEEMTIVQIAKSDEGHIYLIKMHSDRDPIVMPIAHASQATELMDKFTHLLQEDERIAREPGDRTPEQFWNTRRAIDARIKELVFLTSKMNEKDWIKFVTRFCEMRNVSNVNANMFSICYKRFREDIALDTTPTTRKFYTYLIISPDLSQFCWEKLPILASQPFVCRMVSIHAMLSHLESLNQNQKQVPLHVDLDKSYYVLDPDNNLGQTKKRILEFIDKFKWEGTVGETPKPNEVVSALENKDAFFYFGHGSGSKHVNRNTVKQSKCKAISLLMGCGSVRTLPQGLGWDGKSVLLDYVLAKCPLVVGCLWTITDGEIDRYLMRMVDDCFENNSGVDQKQMRQLSEAMENARTKAKLKYLTGASVVMYGFPAIMRPGMMKIETDSELKNISQKVLSSMLDNQVSNNYTNSSYKSPLRSRSARSALRPKNEEAKGFQVFEDPEPEEPPKRITRSRTTRNL
ncbi:unnamed protein product [Caenorhabditis bovis]|uniref:separase n=1 Tax=Caenorhabditis bovis TaxID=2654633 RepID=A0A8S1F8A5_9PELO|nr:unnamed protein product [Caenorhabditis bovis]